MPRGLAFDLEVLGAEEMAERLERISHRMEDSRAGFRHALDTLEAGEARHFRSLRGRYVRTGALRDSLTSSNAQGAIREAHSDYALFGTSIFYGRFLRKGKKSAVLVLKPLERKTIARELLAWIAHDEGAT